MDGDTSLVRRDDNDSCASELCLLPLADFSNDVDACDRSDDMLFVFDAARPEPEDDDVEPCAPEAMLRSVEPTLDP